MKGNKHMYGIVEILVLTVIALLAATVLNSEHLFNWTAHNRTFYLVLCGVPLLLLLLNKKLVSAFITMGIAGGIFIGNYLGAWINNYNESKIVAGMSAEEAARLQHHPGFEIWMGVILLSTVIGVIIQRVLSKRQSALRKDH